MEVIKKFKKKFHSKRIKSVLKDFKNKIVNIYKPYMLWLVAPFILMDIFIFIFGIKINYVNYNFISPILFSISWIFLFLGISLCFKKWIGKLIYLFFNLIFIFLFLLNNIYFSMTKTFFDFRLVESAGEGAPYMMDAIKNCNSLVYFVTIIILVFLVIGLKKFPKIKQNNYKDLIKVIVVFIIFHLFIPITLGRANTDLTWSSWRNPRNIYNAFNDNNKSIKISGFYEYSVRNFYKTFLKTEEQESEEDLEFLKSAYQKSKTHKNKYTGLFKNKNLIIVQLEGTDKWLINKEDTPLMYKMMNEGINFDKHFSYYNGGGSTFNSEFAVNTGFITPLSYAKNAYSFNKSSFPNSMAKLFKSKGYNVNAFHMNNGEYYSRTINYLNWGYDNYYGLLEIDDYDDQTYQLDRELILNKKFDELLYSKDTKFLDYIIAYSGHLPFTNTKGVCKMLYEEDMDKIEKQTGKRPEFSEMSEEECTRRQARESDYMMELLLQKLKENKILDDTIIVVFTDHYLYTLEDQTILDKYKTTSNNLINNTPWFIWSSSIKKNKVSKVTSQLNILPTLLNLFGIEYDTNNYIAEDSLDPTYQGLVFFSDYSWYDGNVYVENGEITNGKKMKAEKLEEKNEYVNYLVRKNDLTLKYNYFKNKNEK